MLHGQPYCKVCGYDGPNLMWMWHHFMGLGVIVQDLHSLSLRAVWVDDPGEFSARAGDSEEVIGKACEAYVAESVARQLGPSERAVPIGEYIRLSEKGEPEQTDLPCPSCRAPLFWRHTGIS